MCHLCVHLHPHLYLHLLSLSSNPTSRERERGRRSSDYLRPTLVSEYVCWMHYLQGSTVRYRWCVRIVVYRGGSGLKVDQISSKTLALICPCPMANKHATPSVSLLSTSFSSALYMCPISFTPFHRFRFLQYSQVSWRWRHRSLKPGKREKRPPLNSTQLNSTQSVDALAHMAI